LKIDADLDDAVIRSYSQGWMREPQSLQSVPRLQFV
jgi:hypothetical protein